MIMLNPGGEAARSRQVRRKLAKPAEDRTVPVITFANTKGGAGKTTAVLLLTTELLRRGYRVGIIDCDPQHWISRWCERRGDLANLSCSGYVTAASIQRQLTRAKLDADYVIIDLPGACSQLMATAIGHSNHIIVPIQGCAMDAQGGAQVLNLLRYLDERGGIQIPHSVLLSRVNPIVTTRALQAVKRALATQRVNVLDTPIIERSVYRDMVDAPVLLHEMPSGRVSNLEKAIRNAESFAEEVLRLVPVLRTGVSPVRQAGLPDPVRSAA